MKQSKYLVLFFALSLNICFSNKDGCAQNIPKINDPRTTEIIEISDSINDYGRIYFKKNQSLSSSDLFVNYKKEFGLGDNDEMVLTKVKQDTAGNKHYRYQQYYKGIKVETCVYSIHEYQGEPRNCLGKIVNNLNYDINNTIKESDATKIALQSINASKYAWQDSSFEQGLKRDLNDSAASWYPKSKLVIARVPNKNSDAEEYSLAYKFEVRTIVPYDQIIIYIDANSGKVINRFSNINKANGTVTTVYNGYRSFTVDYQGFPVWKYRLRDYSRPSVIETKNLIFHSGTCNEVYFGSTPDIKSNDAYWAMNDDAHAGSAHWAVQMAYKYFYDKFGRTYGMREQSGFSIRVHNDHWIGPANVPSAGIGDYIWVGRNYGNNSTNYAGSLDVIGHEFTHGVTRYSADLEGLNIYNFECGAIFESFSDIFGQCVENYILGSTDWVSGTNLDTQIRRSLVSPSSYNLHAATTLRTGCYAFDATYTYVQPYPTTMNGPNWEIPTNTQAAAYININVMNRWFYLLANDIGISKAERIAYNTACYHADINSTFNSIRDDAILAAQNLYGSASCEAKSVQNAWADVGVGSYNYSSCYPPLNVTISGPYDIEWQDCARWTVNASGGTGSYSYYWEVDYGYGYELPWYDYPWYDKYLDDCADLMYPNDFYNMRVTVTSGSQQETAYHNVWVYDGGGYKSQKVDTDSDAFDNTDVTIVPNPSAGLFNVTIPHREDRFSNLKVYNIEGKEILSILKPRPTQEIDISNQPGGIFIIKLISSENVIQKKIIKH
jgi:Zn-dependent metalloprotease